MSLTLEFVEKDYDNLKRIAKIELDKKNYNDCINLISCAANIAYHLNFKFYDDEFEDYLKSISYNLIENIDFGVISGRWVFYDSFGLDNRGLTQQYLNALDDMKVEYLYILETYRSDKEHKDIINQVKNNPRAEIYINDSSLDFKVQIMNIIKVLESYKPEKALLHFTPWKCLSIVLWNRLNFIERYFINLTDHAFWLGKNSFDFSLEAREYGIYFSNKFRYIDRNKLLLSKFYPIINEKEFLGFPQEVKNKIKIFSGGTYYKIYGSNDLYFDIVKKILLKYDNTVLLFAGSGDDKPLREFIKTNNFQRRIFLLGHRSDINEVIKNSDIYLNTYPLGGGLLTQYALLNSIPVIGFGDSDLPMSFTETMTYKKGIKCTYTDLNIFYEEFDYIINNYKEISYDKNIVSPSREEFLDNFKKLVFSKNKIENLEIEDFNFNKQRFFKLYLEQENNYLKQYDLIKFRRMGISYFKYDFFNAVLSALRIMVNNKHLIKKKLIKLLRVNS